MSRNLATSLKVRSRTRPMDRYDRLPAELRAWLAEAALPWSAQSAGRLWTRLLREARGDVAAVLARLDQAERTMLARDCPRIWGESYALEVFGERDRLGAAPCRDTTASRLALPVRITASD